MSGGSFNYLYLAAELGRLGECRGMIAEMAEALDEYDHPRAGQAASDTRRILATLEQADALAKDMAEVWHAVEWHHSCDWGGDDVEEALDKYDEGDTPWLVTDAKIDRYEEEMGP